MALGSVSAGPNGGDEAFDAGSTPFLWIPRGRIVVVGISKEGKQNFILHAFHWTHRHFPNLMDCCPIHVRRALEAEDFAAWDWDLQHMWVPVEIVLAEKPAKED